MTVTLCMPISTSKACSPNPLPWRIREDNQRRRPDARVGVVVTGETTNSNEAKVVVGDVVRVAIAKEVGVQTHSHNVQPA